MYYFFKRKRNNRSTKLFSYFLLLSCTYSGYTAYSAELFTSFVKRSLNKSHRISHDWGWGYRNFTDLQDHLVYDSIKEDDTKSKNLEKRNTSDIVPMGVSGNFVYGSDLKEGKIGIAKNGEHDFVYDNIFKLNIETQTIENKEVYLVYEIKGIDASTLPSKSINLNPVTNGYVVKLNNQWQHVEERIPASWLQNGFNTVFFTVPKNALYQYSVKDLKIILKEKKETSHLIQINNCFGFSSKEEYVYFNGFLPSGFDSKAFDIKVNGKSVKIVGNLFEEKIACDKSSKSLIFSLYKNGYLIDEVTQNVDKLIESDLAYDLEPLDSKIQISVNNYSEYLLYESKIKPLEELRKIDIPTFETSFVNVTKSQSAFRVKSLKVKDSTSFKLFISYDPALLPSGYTSKDIQTFHFDRNYKKWIPVKRDSIITDKNIIVSTFNKNGDYVNGIVQVPESPQTSAFTPTMMGDIKVADPSAGVTLMSPPEVSQKGDANLSYPIKIPSGRNGLQPNLSINYNSDAGNGWLGEGWNINIPAITLDTKWGSPTFDQAKESELYLLNGEPLMYPKTLNNQDWMPNRHQEIGGLYSTSGMNRTGNLNFTYRKLQSFDKIERIGSGTTNYVWKVTDTNGTVYWYGGKNTVDDNAVIKNNQGHIVHWSLYMVEDVHTNNIKYIYNKQVLSSLSGINQNLNGGLVYNIKTIKYTGHSGTDGKYKIDFINETAINRPDININARLGLKQVQPYRLSRIDVAYDTQAVRSYKLEYILGRFEKTLLKKAIETDTHGTNAYEHVFEYYDDIADNILFEKSVNSNIEDADPDYLINIGGGSSLNASEKTEFSWDVRPAVGLELFYKTNRPQRMFTVGFPFGESYQTSKGKIMFSDMNGDGLEDILYKKDNRLFYKPRVENSLLTFGSDIELSNTNQFSKTKGKTKTMFGESVDFMAGGFYAGRKRFKSEETTSIYLNDSNGDQLPDIVRDGVVYFNNGANGFETSSANTPNMLITADIYEKEDLPDPEPEANDFDYSRFDVVRVWEAPYDGTISINDSLVFHPSTATSRAVFSIETKLQEPNATPFRLYMKQFTNLNTSETISLSNYSGNNPPLGSSLSGMSVKKGQKIFFRVQKNSDDANDILDSSPVISYAGQGYTDANGYNTKEYAHSTGFKLNSDTGEVLIEESGTVEISWNDLPLNFTDDIKFRIISRSFGEAGNVLSEGTVFVYDYSANASASDTLFGTTIGPISITTERGKAASVGFFFEVISDSNVNWNNVNWYPKVIFDPADSNSVNGFTKYAIPMHTIFQEVNDINIRNAGNSLQGQYTFKCTNVNFQGVSATNTYYVKPIIPNTTSSNPYSFAQNISGYFTFVVKKNGVLLGKRKVSIINGTFNIDDTAPIPFTLSNPNDLNQVSFEYYADGNLNLDLFYKYTNQVSYESSCSTTVSGNEFISGAANIIIATSASAFDTENTSALSNFRRILIYPCTNLNKNLGPMHRNWGQFLYNSSFNSNAAIPSDQYGKLIDVADLYSNVNQFNPLSSNCEQYANSPEDQQAYEDCMNGSMNGTFGIPSDGTIDPENVGGMTDTLLNNPALSNISVGAAFMLMRAKIETDANLTRRWVGMFKDSYSEISAINCGSSQAGFFPEDYFGHEGEESEPLQSNLFTGMFGVDKEHRSVAVSYSGGYGSLSASSSQSRYSNLLSDFIDVNGDSYPDVITTGSYFKTTMTGGHKNQNAGFGNANSSDSSNFSMAFSKGYTIAGRGGTKTKSSNNGNPSFSAGLGLNLNLSGSNSEKQSFIDINGDGLVDMFNTEASSSNPVKFNYGGSFSGSQDVFQHAAPVTTKPSTLNAPSLNVSMSGTGNVPFSISLGYSATSGNTNQTYVDLNGDSLPDLLTFDGSSAKVRFNLGNRFSSSTMDLRYDTVEPLLTMLNNNKLTSLSLQGNLSIFWGTCIFYLIIPISFVVLVIPFLFFKAGATLGGSANLSISESNKEFHDMNGDGFMDFVQNDGSSIKVYQSKVGKTNKLQKVINPLQGSFTLGYEKQPVTFDNPNPKFALTTVVTNDNIDNVNEGTHYYTKFYSYENGRYDRREREFYGYEIIETREQTQTESRRSVTQYHNKNYFLAGLPIETSTYLNDILDSKTENTYSIKTTNSSGTLDIASNEPVTFDVGGKEGRRQAAALLTKTVQTNYNQGTTPLVTEIAFSYDTWGRVEEYLDKGDISNSGDDYKSVISYHSLNNNIKSVAKKIQVFSGSTLSTLIREREASDVDANTGTVNQVKASLLDQNNQYAVTNIVYDIYGNVDYVMLPENENGQQMEYRYEYDSILHKYRTSIKDSFGYTNSITYDYKFDSVLTNTDIAGKVMEYKYDNLGRVTEIISPRESNAGVAFTIQNIYCPTLNQANAKGYGQYVNSNAFVPFAVTKHYDVQNPSNYIETITFIDGLARPIQVKKDVEVNTGTPQNPVYEEKMSVSGKVRYDMLGRTIRQYQGTAEAKSNMINFKPNLASVSGVPYSNTVFDLLDRPKEAYDFEGNLTKTIYSTGVDSFGQNAYKVRTEVDQTSSVKIITERFTDARGKVISVMNAGGTSGSIWTRFMYNAIGELQSYSDAGGMDTTYKYDGLGRKTRVKNPDFGIKNYTYDLAGNLTSLQTTNLLESSDPTSRIVYHYEYNRPTEVIFPDQGGMANISNVYYKYGDSGNETGRLIWMQDATGTQEFKYGVLGEVIQNERTISAPNLPTRTFKTRFEYDSWNRIQKMIYPDLEEVVYEYNKGGNLKRMSSVLDGSPYDYIKQIDYSIFEEKQYVKYGNDTETFYTYTPQQRRLGVMQAKTSNGDYLFNNNYTYDRAGNVKAINNSATYNGQNYMGGSYNQSFGYDNLNRLATANGEFNGYTVGRDNQDNHRNYTLEMEYNNTHGIVSKRQNHTTQGYLPIVDNSYANMYNYEAGTHKVENVVDIDTGNEERFKYDANGNMNFSENVNGYRYNYWDESNRLRVVNDNDQQMQHYIYDANGERVLKASSRIENVFENGQVTSTSTTMGLYTTYVGAYMVVDSNQRYSKHYFNGSQRVLSRMGEQDISIFETAGGTSLDKVAATNDYEALKQLQKADFNRYLAKNEGVSKKVKVTYEEYKGKEKDTIQKEESNVAAKGGGGAEYELYYYHSDHLGTGTFLTDYNGMPYQFFLNLPFGETMIEQHSYTGEYVNRFKFNGKELDEETGLYYYGARYYNPRTSIWLSVDPLVEKYPQVNPYVYCLDNPVSAIDPDGRDIIFVTGGGDTGKPLRNYIYRKGNFYDVQTGKRYNPGKESVSKTMYKTLEAYRKIEASDNKILKNQLHTLEKSKLHHYVTEGDAGDNHVSKHGIPDSLGENRRTGTKTYYNFSEESKKDFEESEGVVNSDFSTVVHEMRHQYDYEIGNHADNMDGANENDPMEIRAVFNENLARTIEGLPKRTNYGGKIDPKKLKNPPNNKNIMKE